MVEGNYVLAVVIGPRTVRKREETTMFQHLAHFNSIFATSNFPHDAKESYYVHVEVENLLLNPLSALLLRRTAPYSTTSFMRLRNLEESLKQADVINCIETFSFVSYQCAKIAKRLRKKLVTSVFETIPHNLIHYFPPYVRNTKAVLKQTDIFIAYTKKAAEYLRAFSVPKERIKVIYPGIDLRIFYPPSRRSGNEKFRILFVSGYFNPEKGLSILLSAFLQLCEEHQNVELWICVGHPLGKDAPVAFAYAKRYPIKIISHVKHDEMAIIYRQCDVLCLPSYDRMKFGLKIWEEQFGFVLVEAMACGLPIVATNCGAIPEIIGPQNLIVQQKSAEDLYVAFKKIIEDDSFSRYLASANRDRAERLFDIEKQRINLDKTLYEAL